MTENDGAPPGWYPTPGGRQRWWDGQAWGPEAPVEPPPMQQPVVTAVQSAPKPGLVALILSIVVAPVGLVAGIVALVSARRTGLPRPQLAFIATIVGGVGTLLIATLIIVILTVTTQIQDSARATAMCLRSADDPSLVTDLEGFSGSLKEITQGHMPGSGPTAGEYLALADRVSPLAERIGSVLWSDGHGYVATFVSGYDLEERMLEFEDTLRTDPGSLGMDSDMDFDIRIFADSLEQQCS